jgi:hypothetical protein
MPLLASNFTSNSLQGTVVVSGGWANINLQVDAFAFEGDKSFTVKLRKDSTTGQVIGTSNTIAIYDYSGIVSLTANTATVNEGNLVGFTLTTTNVANYTNVFYSVLPVTSNVTLGDFVANTGVVTIINNVGTFALRANSDLSLMDETGETFKLQVRTNSPTGNIVYVSSNVAIADVSKGFNILSFVENSSSVAEGGTLTLTFNATNIPVGTLFYYSTNGNATTSTFTGGNTGSFVMNGLSNTVTLLPTGVPYGITQNFNVVLQAESNSGAVVATSNNIIAIDSALAYMTATGGTIIDSGGYRTHAFTTSGNLTVTALGVGPGNLADYLVVAGGGGGGGGGGGTFTPAGPLQYTGGGGGGAGGLLLSNIVLTNTQNIVITVGAGGGSTTGYGDSNPGKSGGNTIVSFGGATILTVFGGGGGSGGDYNLSTGVGTGRPGGSGGGRATGTGAPAPTIGLGTPGQGYPGGLSSPITFGGVAEDRMGGGGGGAGQAGSWNPTNPTSAPTSTIKGGDGLSVPWAPSAYGTTGPAPGRWFAGGGGGGAHPAGVAFILSGGAGGGGAGGAYPSPSTSAFAIGAAINASESGANATVNTGGGGGGVGYAGASTGYGRGGLGGSGIVLIRYPYAAKTYASLTTTSYSLSHGSNITFTLSVTNANAQTLYYTVTGNVNASNFIGNTSGSFVANTTGAVITLQSNTNIPVGESRYFALQIREDSITGGIPITSANVFINGPAAYILASGGNQVVSSNGYTTHYFLSSNNFVISTLGALDANVEVVSIAGGGGGGGGQYGSGGGGAGGVLWSNISLLGAGNITVTVGAGGSYPGAGATSITVSGSNTRVTAPSVVFNSANLTSVGGGGGSGYNQNPGGYTKGANGGSGGGGHNLGGGGNTPAGLGFGFPGTMFVTQQGYPAGDGINGGGTTGGGGGAGQQGGSGPAVSGNPGGYGGNGIAISWVTPSYGTPGPTPGRWFGGGGAGGKEGTTPGIVIAGGAGGGGTNTGIGNQIGFSGNTNTGGGGSGYNSTSTILAGAAGGSGIVIIRYKNS